MPSPERRPRLDSYGKPLPELTEAREAALFQVPLNQARRQFLHQLVEDLCRAVMHRGWWGTATISLHVEDGMLQPDFTAGLERSWRHRPEEG